MSAEFSDPAHPARLVATTHKQEMVRRLTELARRLSAKAPDRLGLQLSLLINGAFVSSSVVPPRQAYDLLCQAADALLTAHGVRVSRARRA